MSFILTQVYQLPFGKGKKWLGDAGRAADFLIGGWELNGTTNFSSGLPFTPSLSNCHASSDTGPCRPDLVGSIKSWHPLGRSQRGWILVPTHQPPRREAFGTRAV